MTQEEYIENLSKDFSLQELYLLLNSVSVRCLEYQKAIWCSSTDEQAKSNQDMVVVLSALVEKVKHKIDFYEKEDKPRENGVA